jgi:signal transduction histidine kinase
MRRLRAPKALDAGLALVLAIWWIAEVGDELSGTGIASLVLMTVPLAWRRVTPLRAMVVIAAGFVLSETEASPPEPLAGLLVMLIAPYSVAVWAADWRRAVAGGATALASGLAAGLLKGDTVFILVLIAAAWGAGAAVRRLQARSTQLENRAAELDERARTAAASERERIARELHDVISHSVSLMVVQAGAAEQVLGQDPEQARRTLRAIQATGRVAVDDLRRMLGLLRGPSGDGGSRAPQPGLADLDELVSSFSEAGIEVDVRQDPLPPLPAGIDLAAYRIVQEALTNAQKHAPGCRTGLRIGFASSVLQLEARTSSPPSSNGGPGTGHGLIGMRERVTLYGGELEAGLDERADWVVHATLPVARP